MKFEIIARLRPISWLAFSSLLWLSCLVNAQEAEEDKIDQYKDLSLEGLMDVKVVTSVSKKEERLFGAPAAIHVISGEEIRRYGATTIPEALRLAPNLHVAQVDSRQWAISARGSNGTIANKLLVMIDGRAVYTPLFSGVFWDAQDTFMEDIDRIEVISGPGATVWGANAVNGVINVVTRSSRDPASKGFLTYAGAGTTDHVLGGFRYGGDISEDASFRVYGKYRDSDSSRLSNGADASDEWEMAQGGFRSDWQMGDLNEITFQGDIYGGEVDQRGTTEDLFLGGGNLLARWTHDFSEFSELQLQAYYDRTRRKIPGNITDNLSTYDVEFQHRWSALEHHDVVWGGHFRHYEDSVTVVPTGTIGFTPSNRSIRLFSGFVQDEISLVPDKLSLTLGSKFEENDFSGFEYQPSGRLAWTPTEKQTVWAAVSRAVRTPSRIDQDFQLPASPPFLVTSSRSFKSETLIAYELGYRIMPREDLSLSVSTYYHDYDNLRSFDFVFPSFQLGNSLKGEIYGVELTANYTMFDYWRWTAGYNFSDVQLHNKPGSTDTTSFTAEQDTPHHQFLLRSIIDLGDSVDLDATFRYVDNVSNQGVNAYAELDARIAWEIRPGLEVSVVGRNLLDNQHPEYADIFNPTLREVQRGVYGKVTWRF